MSSVAESNHDLGSDLGCGGVGGVVEVALDHGVAIRAGGSAPAGKVVGEELPVGECERVARTDVSDRAEATAGQNARFPPSTVCVVIGSVTGRWTVIGTSSARSSGNSPITGGKRSTPARSAARRSRSMRRSVSWCRCRAAHGRVHSGCERRLAVSVAHALVTGRPSSARCRSPGVLRRSGAVRLGGACARCRARRSAAIHRRDDRRCGRGAYRWYGAWRCRWPDRADSSGSSGTATGDRP